MSGPANKLVAFDPPTVPLACEFSVAISRADAVAAKPEDDVYDEAMDRAPPPHPPSPGSGWWSIGDSSPKASCSREKIHEDALISREPQQ